MLAFTERDIDVVKVVRDGAEALEYIFCSGVYSDRKAKNPRVILLDLKVSKVNSIEVLRQIRYNPRTSRSGAGVVERRMRCCAGLQAGGQ
jgi:CheY-like chemotaxis protein